MEHVSTEFVILTIAQCLSVLACVGSGSVFLVFGLGSYIHEAWVTYGLIGSLIGFFHSWAMAIVFGRVRDLPSNAM